MAKIITRGELYGLIRTGDDRSWLVVEMSSCSRCDAAGPVYVYLARGDLYARCCDLHLGGLEW
jgi:hypothetical protein